MYVVQGDTMKQAVMVTPEKVEFREVPIVEPGKGQVLLRVKRIGVCGSDIHVFHGTHINTPYPVVQGHEVSAVVERAGKDVRAFSPGDQVTFQPQLTCGTCYSCVHGAYHICDNLRVMGFQTEGAASEFFTVDAAKVLKLPRQMSLDHGALVEPIAVAVHALERGGGARRRKVLVLGAGPIGNLVAQAAKAQGASQVMITDVSEYRLDLARSCGIEAAVNAGAQDIMPSVKTLLGPDKADLILECVGSRQTLEQAIGVARKGSDIVIVGVLGEHEGVKVSLVQDRELRLVGTLMYTEKHWKTAIELIRRGLFQLQPLITNHFPFEDYLEAYRYIDANRERAMKVLITMD
jgi:L-iditol 2-dehydrogenase